MICTQVGAESVSLIIHESGHRKSGGHSVGVGRQDLGSIGKTDNGQVGFSRLWRKGMMLGWWARGCTFRRVGQRIKNVATKRGSPTIKQGFKTKPALALEMIEDLEGKVSYDWVGGDGAYGTHPIYAWALPGWEKYLCWTSMKTNWCTWSTPAPTFQTGRLGRGKQTRTSLTKRTYGKGSGRPTLPHSQWKTHTFRQGTKGGKTRQVVCLDVYVWNKRRANRRDRKTQAL